MVSSFAGASERRADNVSYARGPTPIELGGPSPTLPQQFVPADRLEIIRDRFRSEEFRKTRNDSFLLSGRLEYLKWLVSWTGSHSLM